MSKYINDKSLLRRMITENRKQRQRKLKENQDNLEIPLSTLRLFDRILQGTDINDIEECEDCIDADKCPLVIALVNTYRRFPNMTLREILSVDASRDSIECLRSLCLM